MPVLTVDLAIVGAGPTGLYAAYYAGFRGLTTAVLDALPEAGGQIREGRRRTVPLQLVDRLEQRNVSTKRGEITK